jgi:ubiquinone/menaquinone biosynthesis C-methylase UbiE
MNEPMLQAQIDAASAYQSPFVPALFGPWAPKGADPAHLQPGERVLDVACGTAKRLAPAVEWREGVAESLPFPDQS